MRGPAAAIGSGVFFLCVPAVVGGVLPALLTGWQRREPPVGGTYLVVLGVGLVGAGAGVMLHSFARFVTEGRGTPAPIAPTESLVVGGLYRYVRNPMYLAVLAAIVGQGLVLQRAVLWVYAAAVGAAVVAFVRGYEEPALSRRYSEQYRLYRQTVRGWLPRLRAWDPEDTPSRRNGQERASPPVVPPDP